MATPLEKTANVATILVVIVACAALSWQFYTNAKARENAGQPTFHIGDAMAPVPSVDYSAAEHTLLLMVSNTCKYCTESIPFYQELAALQRQGRWRLIAMASQDAQTTTSYLAASGIKVDQIVSVPLGTIGARGTPTIVVVDRSGHITAAYPGVLTGANEAALIKAVQGKTG